MAGRSDAWSANGASGWRRCLESICYERGEAKRLLNREFESHGE